MEAVRFIDRMKFVRVGSSMNHRIWVQIILFWSLVLVLSHRAQAIDNHLIKKIEILGAERTNIDWLYEYLELKAPSVISDYDVEKYSQKLLTTGVYKDVEVYFDVDDPKSNQKILIIRLDEKWTTIPVIRGEFGGGTPLRVMGVYDTHSFGRLWTLGAESRKYGDAYPGYVVWAHAPRWKKGKHALGFELWRDRRMRNIFHQSEVLGKLNTETSRFRFFSSHNCTRLYYHSETMVIGIVSNYAIIHTSYLNMTFSFYTGSKFKPYMLQRDYRDIIIRISKLTYIFLLIFIVYSKL